MRRMIAVVLLALVATACGGGDDDDAGQSDTTTSGATEPESTTTAVPEKDLIVETQTAIHEPDQSGGNFYEVFVVVHNPRDEVALDVGGQVSLKDESGQLIESVNPTEINILAGGRGLIHEVVDLDTVPTAVTVEAALEAADFRDGPASAESPVTFTNVRLAPDEISGCQIAGTVSNTFSENKDDLQLRVVGFNGDTIVTGGFTYVDHVIAGTDATFEVDLFSPALCPASVERLEVLPNLGEDKIFNP